MKITLTKAEECINSYVSKELCPKMPDWRKWVVPVMIGMYIPTLERKFNDNIEVLKSSGFVDSEGLIDIDLVYDKFHRVAEESGDIVQEIPMIGSVRFTSRDIEAFYRLARM